MILESFLFYVFAGLLTLSALSVISVKNPVHAVLFLIMAFFNGTALFILLGAELIAMLLAIVYVGAVAVLFLFVVMMLDIDFASFRDKGKRYLSIGGVVGLVLLAEIYLIVSNWGALKPSPDVLSNDIALQNDALTNSHMLGTLIYTDYVLLFQLAGMILLVAMIGAIVLTLRTRGGIRKQNVKDQIGRSISDTVETVSVKTGAGLKEGS